MPIHSNLGGAAALQAGGNLVTSALQVREAKRNRAFQERMSSTAYQRSMTDMRLAGLNPILAYAKGGASTPGGATAQVTNPMGGVVSSAVQTNRVMAEIENIEANTALTRAKRDVIAVPATIGTTANEALTTGINLLKQPSLMQRLVPIKRKPIKFEQYSPAQQRKFRAAKRRYKNRSSFQKFNDFIGYTPRRK